ncbi:LPD23 domain-containing protein [Xanthobacter aminoxidans]|uniref:LPD23 domain-containing protein n=1 Tax=Xanthobacter aminoxidans TaxID=186280 RepID=UPI002022CF5F|nr:LPD23 domain-containing protein [Xanthobacter aminoxidans]MCL8384161.1 hypothetical protein [Xanthobacter aminoxidans]
MDDTLGLGPQSNIETTELPAPGQGAPPSTFPDAGLPDTQGAAPVAPDPAPAQSLPDTSGADQNLPQPTQAAPGVDPIPARPGDPDQTPITPAPAEPKVRRRAGGWTASDPAVEYATREVLTKQRQSAINELANDPELRSYVFGLMRLETGDHPETAMENLINRSVMYGKSVRELVFNGGNTAKSFYGPVRRGIVRPEQSGSAYYQKAMSALEDIAAGSNYVGLTTDQGMENEHAFADANPSIGGKIKVGNEWFSRKGMEGVRYAQSTQAEIDKRVAELRKSGLPLDFTGPKTHWVDTAPGVTPAGSPEDVAAGVAKRTFNPPPTFWQTVESAADESTTAYLFRDSPVFAPAPDYQPTTEELEQRKQGLPEKYWGQLLGVSPAHSDYLTAQAHRQYENELNISRAGWTGTGVSLAAGMLDPTGLAVAISTGGLGAAAGGAMKLGAVGSRIAAGAAAAGGNLALTAGEDALGKSVSGEDYAMAAAFGAGLGFAFGPFGRNPATEDIAARGSVAANRVVSDIQRGTPVFSGGEGSLSAAVNPENTMQFSKGDLMKVGQDDASRTAVEAARPDMAGRVGSSKNPLARKVGEALGLDVVGRKDANGDFVVNPVSAGEDKLRIMHDADNRFYSTAYPQFKEWADAKGIPWWKSSIAPRMTQAWEDFGDAVSNYTRDMRPDRDAHYDPQVVKVGKQLNALMEEHRQGNLTPRAETPDNPGRALAGRENVPPNSHYLPRVWRLDKISKIDASGRKFKEWFEGALLASHKELGDKAYTIANGVWENLNRRAYGLDEFFMMSRDGATADVIRSGMRDMGLSEADIDEILARLPKGSKPGFMHFRIDIDENYVHPRTGLKLGDFVENNAFDLFDHYNHQASAWRAAGRIQLVRKDGEVLMDGIRSRQEMNNVLEQVAAKGAESGQSPKEIANDVSLLKEEFDRLLGVPSENANTRVAQGLEILRNLGTATMGGNFGLSAIPDMARLATIGGKATQGGLRAMLQHMPAFRTHILEGGVLKATDDLGRDIAALGAVDEFKHLSARRAPEDGMLTAPMDGALAKIAGATKATSDFVVSASGMNAINHRVRGAARRILADRFYRDAKAAYKGLGKASKSVKAVRDDIKAQLVAAGVAEREARINAEIVSARYAARAERLGEDALKLYQKEGIEVRSGKSPDALGPGEMGQFAGVRAKTSNIDDLMMAIDLEGKGFGPDDIWAITGWGKGKDGKWRFEVPDDKGKIAPRINEALDDAARGAVIRLRDVYRSPELEAAYPSLFDLQIKQVPVEMQDRAWGYFDHNTGSIALSPLSPDHHGTLLHEIQHAIQYLEGHGYGTDPEYLAKRWGLTIEEARDFYRRMSGEVESRSTEVRGHMTAEQRRDLPPWFTGPGAEDTPRSRQWVMYPDGKVPKDQSAAPTTPDKYAKFFQSNGDGYRGSITSSRNKAVIQLFEERDASTFMHEMGHQWLGEMIQDAQINKAAKKDLDTVLKWLGVDDVSKIGRKEHEQWAQGFEQYLREGKAPTPQLQGAFQNFRAWLVRIYQSVKGLGTPISDDVRGVMDRMLAGDAAEKFDLSKLSKAERNRLKWFGMDDEMLPRVLAQVAEHSEVTSHWTGAKLSRLHPEEWTDPEAKTAFASALNRAAGRASMEHDFGAGTVYDRSPIFRTFAQLRRFALNAWHMNILNGWAMRDSEAFADVVWSTTAGAALYAGRTRIQAATQEDPQKYLDEKLTPGAIAMAAFQLSAYSSLIPGLLDIGIGMTGANPMFGYRNSALPSDAWFGNPSVAFINNVLRVAPSALFQPIITGRERSQQEWKQLLSVLPFSNNIAVQGALSHMVRDAPQKPPKNPGFDVTDFLPGS